MSTKDDIRLENLNLHAILVVGLGYDDDSQRINILKVREAALVTMDISTCIMTIS